MARAWREKLLEEAARDTIFGVLEADFAGFEVTEVRRAIVERIPPLVLRQPLRAYDAIQLASALAVKERGVSVDFWGADDRLVTAACGEGLRATLVAP